MNRIFHLLQHWANWKTIALLTALFLTFTVFILPAAASADGKSLSVLDRRFWYTPQQAYEAISQYSPEARQAAMLTHLSLDVMYPLIYGLLLSLLLLVVYRHAPVAQQSQLVLLPWRAVFADLFENTGLVVMFALYPARFSLLSWLTAIFTALKWLQLGLSLLVLLIGVLLLISRKIKRSV
ncbi:MAG: hypothetical protein N2049_05710 [Anaerolineales bacterium]|nr:hypothetical protein [Anaerolineales bacterium]